MKFTKYFSSFLIIISLFLNSCTVTSNLWKNKIEQDTINQFLISEDGKVAFIGQKYHYIFDDQSGFVTNLLAWNKKPKLEVTISKLKVSTSNEISGNFIISVKAVEGSPDHKNITMLTQNELSFLKNLGFQSRQNGNDVLMTKQITLKGTIYLPDPNVDYKLKSKLSKDYKVTVEFESNLGQRAGKIAITPITVTADAIFIGGVAVLVVFFAVLWNVVMIIE
ncbi:MAG: hypothetical protein V4612_01105 [Pseudomonadota bacterium]